jgi:hypothetical protein
VWRFLDFETHYLERGASVSSIRSAGAGSETGLAGVLNLAGFAPVGK